MKVQTINPFEVIDSRLQSIENILSELSSTLRTIKTPEAKYYTIADAAKKLGVAEITLRRNIQSEKIPSKRIGCRIMIPGSFVDK